MSKIRRQRLLYLQGGSQFWEAAGRHDSCHTEFPTTALDHLHRNRPAPELHAYNNPANRGRSGPAHPGADQPTQPTPAGASKRVAEACAQGPLRHRTGGGLLTHLIISMIQVRGKQP